ncbi:hypothetical protein Q5P01_017847 [Channa striata]|uniref:C-type lectin domain-containing protein n=1 Tax=Channa striata TaxID=64152 RepID=A0AA88MB06_CHASR|nr:hypothetical protein Q5P01_017847 [Channa striata]
MFFWGLGFFLLLWIRCSHSESLKHKLFSGKAGTPSSSFVLVNQSMTWSAAQQYCRLHHTDLASVRNQAENSQIKTMLQSDYTWIGLYRNSWKWSDGSPLSVSNWNPGAPTTTSSNVCVVSYFGKWVNLACTSTCYSACFLGLCFLPACYPRFYVLVREQYSWTVAQQYCRSHFDDLAVAQNAEQLTALNKVIGSQQVVWTGLHADIESWRWSLENQTYYGAGENAYRKWAAGSPKVTGYFLVCVAMLGTGQWTDQLCVNTYPFICYNDPSSSFIFVNQNLTWMDAQQYCRANYTDLASVRNQTENDQIKTMIQNQYTWIGLYRNSWQWSDGSPLSISNWDPTLASTPTTIGICVAARYGKWYLSQCFYPKIFACFSGEF